MDRFFAVHYALEPMSEWRAVEVSPRSAIEGSRMRRGDAPVVVSFAQLLGRPLVVREMLDGVGVVVACEAGEPTMHGSAHALEWIAPRRAALHAALGDRYALHGQWLHATRIVYYDALPQPFVATDVYDRERNVWLASAARAELLARASVVAAPVLHEGPVGSIKALHAMVPPSRCKTPRWREALRAAASAAGLDVDATVLAIDPLDLAMGVLVDVEHGDAVVERHELVRPSYGTAVLDAEVPLMNASVPAP